MPQADDAQAADGRADDARADDARADNAGGRASAPHRLRLDRRRGAPPGRRRSRPHAAAPGGRVGPPRPGGQRLPGPHPQARGHRRGGRAARRWGAGATGSRLVTGTTLLHTDLERELAAFCGFEAALVFSSGYAANLAVLTALGGRDSLIVSDAANHASLVDGCRLARAETAVVPHADPDAVRKTLEAHPGRRALVVSDSVFSVDGDRAPLAELAAVCRAHGAGLVVDDAHGFGVLGDGGRGALHGAGLAGDEDVVATLTLSKSLGSQGGAVLGPARVIEHLVNAARTFIFDTGSPRPPSAAPSRACA